MNVVSIREAMGSVATARAVGNAMPRIAKYIQLSILE